MSQFGCTEMWGNGNLAILYRIRRHLPAAVCAAQVRRIFRFYGGDGLAVARGNLMAGRTTAGTDCFDGEIRHAVRAELAATLADVVMRRLELGPAESQAASIVTVCAAPLTTNWVGMRPGAQE